MGPRMPGVSQMEAALAKRIEMLRLQHRGPPGQAAFARELGIAVDELAKIEEGAPPPGELLVRICDVTGADLRWLLTGENHRVPTAAHAHALTTRLIHILGESPHLAGAVSAFLDLLQSTEESHAAGSPMQPTLSPTELMPLLDVDLVPVELPDPRIGVSASCDLNRFAEPGASYRRTRIDFAEPSTLYDPGSLRSAELLTIHEPSGRLARCVYAPEISSCFPNTFGVSLVDDEMQPMFSAGDAVLVSLGVSAKIGRPCVCRVKPPPHVRCRIWLGTENGITHLGRLADGATEQIASDGVGWALEVLYRLSPAT